MPRTRCQIKRKDGTVHSPDLRYYLDLLREDQSLQRDFLRLWAMGALLTLGDELTKHKYFDQAPILELVYHLRNGIAHGNQFCIDSRGKQRLVKHPAHNRHAAKKSPLGTLYEIVDSPGDIGFFHHLVADNASAQRKTANAHSIWSPELDEGLCPIWAHLPV